MSDDLIIHQQGICSLFPETRISFCWQASRKSFLRLRKATPAVGCGRNFEIPVSSFRGRGRLNVTVRTKCARQTSSIALRIGIKSFCLIGGVRRQCRASFQSVHHHTSMCWSMPLPQTEVSATSFRKKWGLFSMEAIQTEFETSKPKTASLESSRFLSLLRLT